MGSRAQSRLIIAAAVVLLAIPLVVAVVALRQPRWYPTWDQALTEMQLRDVGTSNTPLVSAGGRVGARGEQGSHPGPIGFYMMAPVYRLFGSTSWAMQAATAFVHLAAVAAILWLVSRRRSVGLVLGMTALLAVLLHGLGPEAITKAWIPYLPMVWWVVFLLAVWLVMTGDLPVLPVVVFAGSFCVQNHASYVVLISGLTTLALLSVGIRAYQQRDDRSSVLRAAKWCLVALGVGVAVWLPPLIDQLGSGDNLGILWRHFRNWNEDPIGLRGGFEQLLTLLNPWRLATGELFFDVFYIQGTMLPGGLLLAAWAAAAVTAVLRLRDTPLVRLHAVVAAALILAWVTLSRLEFFFYYLVMWTWGLQILVLFATGWTVALLVRRRMNGAPRAQATKPARLVLIGVAVLFTGLFAIEAAGVEYGRRESAMLDRLVPQVAAALERNDRPSDSYLLMWSEYSNGAVGRGLMSELERRGFEVGAGAYWRAEVKDHRVLSLKKADAVIVLVTGPDIETWRAKPEARQIARFVETGSQPPPASDQFGTSVFLVPPAAAS